TDDFDADILPGDLAAFAGGSHGMGEPVEDAFDDDFLAGFGETAPADQVDEVLVEDVLMFEEEPVAETEIEDAPVYEELPAVEEETAVGDDASIGEPFEIPVSSSFAPAGLAG